MLNHQEIERKWLLTEAPTVSQNGALHIVQGYLSLPGKNATGNEVRLRSCNKESFYMTLKSTPSADGMVRREAEINIDQEQFNVLWPFVGQNFLEKTRHTLAWKEWTLEVDIFHGRHAGLFLVEVEFPSKAASAAFEIPEWFGQEVTAEARFKNAALATKPAE